MSAQRIVAVKTGNGNGDGELTREKVLAMSQRKRQELVNRQQAKRLGLCYVDAIHGPGFIGTEEEVIQMATAIKALYPIRARNRWAPVHSWV